MTAQIMGKLADVTMILMGDRQIQPLPMDTHVESGSAKKDIWETLKCDTHTHTPSKHVSY